MSNTVQPAIFKGNHDGCFCYYAYPDTYASLYKESNRESCEVPLFLNCSGFFTSKYPFTTDKPNGRRDYYLMYIVSGNLEILSGDSPTSVSAGTLLVFQPNKRYAYTHRTEDTLSYFWAHFTGSESKSRLSEYSIETFPKIYKTEPGSSISNRFRTIFDAFSKQDSLRERELSALLDRLLVTVSRSIVRKGEKGGVLSKSISYINANYSSQINIAELASMEHLSVSRFNFLFKEQTSVPPTKYIIALRMSSARDLLSSTDLPVKQIGVMCGYPDPQFFSKVFKLNTGTSPAKYRRKFI